MIRVLKPNGTRLSIRKNGASYIARLFNAIYKTIVSSFKTRVLAAAGTFEAEDYIKEKLGIFSQSLFNDASYIITPNGYKTSKVYALKPDNGTGDLGMTRNTTATRINEYGIREIVSANRVRIDYSKGKPRFLVEPQRTNLVYPSDIATTQVRAVTAVLHTLSFYGTGTVTLSGAFSGSLVGTGTNNRVTLSFTPTAGNLTLTVSGTVTDWQLEVGSRATSLIKTVSGSVTRNADVISKYNIDTLIGQTEGTILVKGAQFDRGVVFRVRNNNSINVNRLFIFCIGDGGRVEVGVMKNNVTVSTWAYLPMNRVSEKNIIMVYSQNVFKVFISGYLIYTYNYPTPTDFTSVLNTFEFGSLTEKGIAAFDMIALWKTTLTDQQAIQLTTL